MAYHVIEIKPVPTKDTEIEDEIKDATSGGDELVCIEMDAIGKRLLIITKS